MRNLVLDAGALIALERRDRRMLALLRELIAARIAAHVPAAVVAQVWRGSPRQHAMVRLLRAKAMRVHPLDEPLAFRLGLLLAATGTADVVDAHVAVLGGSLNALVISSDPEDLRRIDESLDIVEV